MRTTGYSLLKRIANPEHAAPRRAISDVEIRNSVLQHLQQICSTRLGSMLTAPDFGVHDVSDIVHDFPEAATIMARELKNTIETYEPRLKNVRVRFAPGEELELVLRFEVTAQLIREDGTSAISFETCVDANRRVSVT